MSETLPTVMVVALTPGAVAPPLPPAGATATTPVEPEAPAAPLPPPGELDEAPPFADPDPAPVEAPEPVADDPPDAAPEFEFDPPAEPLLESLALPAEPVEDPLPVPLPSAAEVADLTSEAGSRNPQLESSVAASKPMKARTVLRALRRVDQFPAPITLDCTKLPPLPMA